MRQIIEGILLLFLCSLSILIVGVYVLLALMGKISASTTTIVCLTGFNLFTYIWYTEFYSKRKK